MSSIEKIKSFKDNTISAIWQAKKELDGLKERVIREIETKLAEKGINESDFFQEGTDWREKIRGSFRTEKVEKEGLAIVKNIEKFSNSSSEEERDQSRQEFRDETERLRKEEENKNNEEKKRGQQNEEKLKKHLAEEKEKKQNEKEQENKNNQEGQNDQSDNSNQKPTNNSPTQQRPPIDTAPIEQVENINEAITIIKTQIQQTLKSHNLKTSDLPPKYQNWEEQLTKLKSKEEINSLVTELNQQIKNKLEELKRKQNQKSNKQQPFPLHAKIFLGIVISSVILSIIVISSRLVRRKKK